MTSSERPSPQPLLKKVSGIFRNFLRKVPAVLWVWPVQGTIRIYTCISRASMFAQNLEWDWAAKRRHCTVVAVEIAVRKRDSVLVISAA